MSEDYPTISARCPYCHDFVRVPKEFEVWCPNCGKRFYLEKYGPQKIYKVARVGGGDPILHGERCRIMQRMLGEKKEGRGIWALTEAEAAEHVKRGYRKHICLKNWPPEERE